MTVRILVADDSITIQKIVAMAFENEDAEVEGIGDGQEAFDRIADFKPDIVLADVDMPGLDGFQLSQKIKETSDLANIKVLLLASDFEDFDEDRFKKCQAENHISKPFKSDDIVQMVTRVMEGASAAVDEPVLQESVVEEESNIDDEPSLEELLESVEKLSTDSNEIANTEEPLGVFEDASLSAEHEEPEQIEEEMEPSSIIDDDILSGMIQEVEDEISKDSVSGSSNNDILDEMIQEVEEGISNEPVSSAIDGNINFAGMMEEEVETELEEDGSEQESTAEEPALEDEAFSDDFEVYAEVQTGKMENLDDLDSAFKEIVSGDSRQQHAVSSENNESEISALGGIVPEPEDLLERMAPGAFSESERRPYNSDEINENLNAITGSSSFRSGHYQDSRLQEMEYENNDDRFIQVTGEQVKHVLEKSLGSSLQKEMSGLSEIIVKTIREVVREITPEIARSVIREEIEKIKKI